ncbi:MAG: DUF4397 domain-containing protein [Actinomycetia bacterium]|nr:DUF4397 domain-containing protein [Actinomycetes bacterium]
MSRSRISRAGAVMALTLPVALFPLAAANAAQDAQVSVFHGIPDLTVDVYVNGDLTLDDFKPGDIAGPLALPADTYSIEITDKDDKKTVLLGPADVTVAAGGNYTIVANLDAKGDPALTPFENDISEVAAGEARVTVRHVAMAPKVDIEANGDVLAPGLVNGDEAVADVPADSYDVAIVPAGGGNAVWKENVDLGEGVNTIAYAWGSPDDGSFAVGVQTIDGLHSAPGAVHAGEVGLADSGSGTSPWLIGALVGSVLVGSAAAVRLVQVRS